MSWQPGPSWPDDPAIHRTRKPPELTFRPQTADQDGDFALAVLTEGQYEIIRPWTGSWTGA
jgi:hypothetical protein